MQIPSVVKSFLAENADVEHLFFTGEIDSIENDVHAIELDPEGAGDVLEGEDDGFDEAKHAPLGFLTDLPMFVDVSKKALPVLVLLDGEATTVASSFDEFVENCEADEDYEGDEDE